MHNPGSDPAQVKCIVKDCKSLSDDLASLLSSGEIWAFGNWCENVRKKHVQCPYRASLKHFYRGKVSKRSLQVLHFTARLHKSSPQPLDCLACYGRR